MDGRLRTAAATACGSTSSSRAIREKAHARIRTSLDHSGRSRSDERHIERIHNMESRLSGSLGERGQETIPQGSQISGCSCSMGQDTFSDDYVSRLLKHASLAHAQLLQALRQENSELRAQLKANGTRIASVNTKKAHDDQHAVPCEAKLSQPRFRVVAVSQPCSNGSRVNEMSTRQSSSLGLDVAHAADFGDGGIALDGTAMPADIELMDKRQSDIAAKGLPDVNLVRLVMSPQRATREHGLDCLDPEQCLCFSDTAGQTGNPASQFQTFGLKSVWEEARRSSWSAGHQAEKTISVKGRTTTRTIVSDNASSRCSLIVHPGSTKKFLWDSMASLAMTFDVITLPFILAFDALDNDRTLAYMVWFTRVFWSADILASFLTGYYTHDEQQVVMGSWKIAVKYTKTWLAFDFGIVCIDWVIYAAGTVDAKTYARASRLNRLFRGLRLLRTLRFLKVMKYKRFIEDIASSEVAHANLNVLRMLSVIVVVSHLIGCFWFFIGSSDPSGWVFQHMWAKDSIEYKYTTAYHWAVMHLGVGEVEIEPQTTMERCFSIGVVLCGLLNFSLLVSSATNSLAQLQTNQAEHRRQHSLFLQFCRQNQVPRELINRIMRFLRYEMVELHKQRVDPRDVSLLNMLSGPLYTELLYCMYSPILQKHNVFRMLCRTWPQVAQKISLQVLSSKYLATSDMLFDQGEEADNIFWVMSGQMEYARKGWPSWTVEEESWISEPALWTMWVYQGSLQAIGPCRLLVIDVDEFVEVILTSPGTWLDITSYAQSFVDYMNSHASDFCFDVTHDHTFDSFDTSMRVREKPERPAHTFDSFDTSMRVREKLERSVSRLTSK